MSDLIVGEIDVIEKYIKKDSVVFDVGGFRGEWSNEVLKRNLSKEIHIFEPVLDSHDQIVKNLEKYKKKIHINFSAVSNNIDKIVMWKYTDVLSLSTKYKRDEELMSRLNIQEPTKFVIPTIDLDSYCLIHNISVIDFLKIDVEGSELDVLKGADRLLKGKQIKYIQFEYGGCFLDAGITLEDVFSYLKSRGYDIGKIKKDGKVNILTMISEQDEDFGYCNYLGILK